MISIKYLVATAIATGFAGTASAAIVQNANFAPTDITGLTIQNWTPTIANAPNASPITGSAESLFNSNPTLQLTTGIWNNGSVSDGLHGADGYQSTVGFETVSSGTPVGLSQTLALIAGQTYTLSFYANADLGNSVVATALVGGASVFSATTGSNDAFTLETATFTATSASEVLTLSASEAAGAPATLLLAGVTVTPVATPEPASIALLGAGLAATGLMRRRRA